MARHAARGGALVAAWDDRIGWTDGSARRKNVRVAELRYDDHAPACPRCGDLLHHGAKICPACYARVTEPVHRQPVDAGDNLP